MRPAVLATPPATNSLEQKTGTSRQGLIRTQMAQSSGLHVSTDMEPEGQLPQALASTGSPEQASTRSTAHSVIMGGASPPGSGARMLHSASLKDHAGHPVRPHAATWAPQQPLPTST
jgi:hypothetical protein